MGGLSWPVYVTAAPKAPSTLYVVEQSGTIRIVRNHQIVGTFLDIASLVKSGGELGLLSIGQGRQLGRSRYEGDVVFHPSHRYTNLGQKVFPVLVYPHTGGRCAITGGYVYKGRYYYGDNCSGGVWSFRVGKRGRAGAPRQVGNLPSISSFGIDGAGHLFGVSLGGSLYELE